MSGTVKHHVNRTTGRVGVCHATEKRGCPLGDGTPHFDNKADAEAYVERSISEVHDTFPVVSKKSSRLVCDYKYDDRYKSFGVGKFKKLSSSNGRYWDDDLVVEYRKCENFPEQYFDADKWSDRLTDHKEIAVNGEVIGYVALKTPQRGKASNKVYVFETIEQANDPFARVINTTYGPRKACIGVLISHHRDYVTQAIDVDNPQKYFTSFEHGQVTSKTINDQTSIIVEEKSHVLGMTIRNVFLVKDGKAVSYIRMTDESFENVNSEVKRQTVRCNVETRNRDRRRGYARELSNIIEQEYDCKLQSGGSFTPLGFAAFGDNPHRTLDQVGASWKGSTIAQMNFVFDWDKLHISD